MSFNTLLYVLIFLPLTVSGYSWLNRRSFLAAAPLFLIFASLVFYSCQRSSSLVLLGVSILLNYTLSCWIGDSAASERRRSKSILALGISANVAVLGYFKYHEHVAAKLGDAIDASFPLSHLAVPLALSFFTFQQIAYLVDVYTGDAKRPRFRDYLLFVTFFPKLICGPIVNFAEFQRHLSPSFRQPPKADDIARGTLLLLFGFIKKVVIADSMAAIAHPRSLDFHHLTFVDAWVTSVSAALQIYFDFSGYSDMAIASALFLGVRLPSSLNSPHQSKSLIDFWNRWNISLTRFLTQYLYFPIMTALGRSNLLKFSAAVLLTTLISGVWHEPTLGFFLWGVGHGAGLIVNHVARQLKIKLPRVLSWMLTFSFVISMAVIARSKEVGDGLSILGAMYSPPRFQTSFDTAQILFFGASLAVILFSKNSESIADAIVERTSFARTYLPAYLRRAPVYLAAGYLLVFTFNCFFYSRMIDRAIYRAIPIQTDSSHIEDHFGDLRSNFLINEIFQGDERKIVIIGGSPTRLMGAYRFAYNGVQYKSGTVGYRGVSILNGLKTAGYLLETPGIDTLIFAMLPGYGVPIYPSVPFPDEGLGLLRAQGLDYQSNKFLDLLPVQFTPLDFVRLFFNPGNRSFKHLHGFYHNLLTRAFRTNPAPAQFLEMNQDSRHGTALRLAEKILAAHQPVGDRVTEGLDMIHNWRMMPGTRHFFGPDSATYKALANLKKLADEKGVRLVVYNPPSPRFEEAPYVYPEHFIESYRALIGKMMNDLGIQYFDLSEFFPFRGEFMEDFVHSQPEARGDIHKWLLYEIFSNQNKGEILHRSYSKPPSISPAATGASGQNLQLRKMTARARPGEDASWLISGREQSARRTILESDLHVFEKGDFIVIKGSLLSGVLGFGFVDELSNWTLDRKIHTETGDFTVALTAISPGKYRFVIDLPASYIKLETQARITEVKIVKRGVQ